MKHRERNSAEIQQSSHAPICMDQRSTIENERRATNGALGRLRCRTIKKLSFQQCTSTKTKNLVQSIL